jgi:hypothetical protein
MSYSLTSARIAQAAVVATIALALAAPAMAAQPKTDHPVLPAGHHSQAATQPATEQSVLPSAHHGQTSAQLPGPSVQQSSNGSSWNDVATVAVAALLGSGITLGAMTLWRRRDQPLSV